MGTMYDSYRPSIPIDRRKASSEGRIGGVCHATTMRGHFCKRKAVMVAEGYGYCQLHIPKGWRDRER